MESEPFTNLKDIELIHQWLTNKGCVREAELFIISCNFALRIGDLLKTTVAQSQQESFVVTGNEEKTDKYKELPINAAARKAIDRLLLWYRNEVGIEPVYLFQSTSRNMTGRVAPITPRHFNNKLKEAAEAIGLDVKRKLKNGQIVGTFGCSSHSSRKAFGYHRYMSGTDIRYLQVLYNHKTEFQTLTYIGVTRRTVKEVYLSSEIGIDIK